MEISLQSEEFGIEITQTSPDEFSLDIVMVDEPVEFEIQQVIIAATPSAPQVLSVHPYEDIHENQKLLTTKQGAMIPDIVVMETEGNDVTISLGTYPGGNDIIEEYAIIGGQPNFLLLNYISHINLTPVDLYISSDDWNGANLNIYITQKTLA